MTREQEQAIARARARMRLENPDRENLAPLRGRDEVPPSLGQSILRGAAQGMNLGWNDELVAGVKTGFGFLGDYPARLAEQRAGHAAARQAHPAAYMGAELAGNLPSAAVPIGVAARGASMAGKMAGGVVAGGLQGGLYGAGSAEGSRAGGATVGTIAGAGIGGAFPVLGRGVGALASHMFPRNAPRLSGRGQVSRAYEADAVNPQALRDMGPEGMLLDAGPNLRQQAGALGARPGEAQRIIRDAMEARAAASGDRVRSMLERDVAPEQNIPETIDDIATRRNAEATGNYRRAYNVPVTITPTMQEALATPAGRTAVMRAQRLAANNREPFTADAMDTRSLHFVGQALGDMIRDAKPGTANHRALTRLQRVVYDDLEAQNLPFKEAQAAYAEPSRLMDAMTAGQEVFRRTMSPNELMRMQASMSTAEREAFRKGARDAIGEIMGTARNDAGAAYRELAEKGWNREKLSIVIGRDEAERLVRGLGNERTFANSAQEITRNSETARRMSGIQDLQNTSGPGPIRQGYNAGGTLGLIRSIATEGADKLLTGVPDAELDKIATEMARMLTARGPERDAAVAALAQLQSRHTTNAAVVERMTRLTEKVVMLMNAGTQPALAEMQR